jgi:serine/threonine protein kinase
LGAGENWTATQAAKTRPKTENWELLFREVEFKERLGQSPFGETWSIGYFKDRPTTLKKWKLGRSPNQEGYFDGELRTLMDLKHPNLAPVVGSINDRIFGTLEALVEGPSLHGWLRNPTIKRDDEWVLTAAKQIVSAMTYLHKKGVLHRSLHSHNIFITRDNQVVLKDYGFSKLKDAIHQNGEDESSSMAPEIFQSNAGDYTEKSDVYSFGLVLWEMLTGKDAFGSLENREIAIEAATNQTRPVIPPCPIVLEKLMRACWAVDPASRPAFEYIGKILDKPASMLLAYATGANRAPTTDSAREAEAATAGLHQDADKLGVLVRKLITMLDSEDDFENLKACKTLQSLAKMENTGRYFATDGGLPHLFKFIRSPGRVQEEALRALAVLAEDDSVTAELARDNIFSVLLKMLGQENDIIRTIVFKVLIAAAKHPEGRENLASLKAVGTVFEFLSGSENIQALAIDCLGNLVEEHEGNQATLISVGGLSALLGLLQTNNLGLLTRVLRALGNMASSKKVERELRESPLFDHFVKLLNSRTPMLQGLACNFMAKFAQTPHLRPLLVQIGASKILVKLIDSTDQNIRITALRTLSFLLCDKATKQAILDDSELAEFLSNAVEADEGLVQLAAFKVINLVAEEPALEKSITRFRWPLRFVAMARRVNPLVREELVAALGHMSLTPAFATQMLRANALHVLVPSLSSQKHVVQEKALLAIGNIARNPEQQGEIISMKCVPQLLKLLDSESSDVQSLAMKAILVLSANPANAPVLKSSGAGVALQRHTASGNPALRAASSRALQFLG